MVGQEAQHTRENSSYLAGSNYPVEYLSQIELAAKPSSASTSLDNVALASFFFNGQYDYANKYYLSASVRTDGSSRFGSNNRWATFYSVGALLSPDGRKFYAVGKQLAGRTDVAGKLRYFRKPGCGRFVVCVTRALRIRV